MSDLTVAVFWDNNILFGLPADVNFLTSFAHEGRQPDFAMTSYANFVGSNHGQHNRVVGCIIEQWL